MELLFVCRALCRFVEFTILYERNQPLEIQKFSQYVISKVVDDYNIILKRVDIKLKLEALLPYNEYATIPSYSSFAKLAGSTNLYERLNALKDIDTNLLILFSSVTSRVNGGDINNPGFCKGRYFLDLKSLEPGDDIYTASIKAVKKWIEYLLKTALPKVYEMSGTDIANYVDPERVRKLKMECYRSSTTHSSKMIGKNSILVVGPISIKGSVSTNTKYNSIGRLDENADTKNNRIDNNRNKDKFRQPSKKYADLHKSVSTEISSDDIALMLG